MAQCIVIVQFDLPKRTEEQAIKGGMATAPTYRNLATKGLIRKDYLNGEAGTGGVYLWESRAAAEAWFSDAKMAELTERFGAPPRLTWYDTYVTVDNLAGETRVNQTALSSAAEQNSLAAIKRNVPTGPKCSKLPRSADDTARKSFRMSRTPIITFCLSLLTLSAWATGPAIARGGFNPNCHVPRISLCPGCTITAKIVVLQDHECRINYGSLGPMRPQTILVSAKHGKYRADNETSTAYTPNKGFLGDDYFETRFSYELMNGSAASAVLKASVEVVPKL